MVIANHFESNEYIDNTLKTVAQYCNKLNLHIECRMLEESYIDGDGKKSYIYRDLTFVVREKYIDPLSNTKRFGIRVDARKIYDSGSSEYTSDYITNQIWNYFSNTL